MTSLPRLALTSVSGFVNLVRADAISRPKNRLGRRYCLERGGTYEVFRETIGNDSIPGQSAVLVVGFRLKAIGSNQTAHWFFERICLLTTPFWSGFRGFRVKLWMVDRETKNYLGIYKWAGEEHARIYAEALSRVLRALSTTGSVWYDLYPGQELDQYLAAHATGD